MSLDDLFDFNDMVPSNGKASKLRISSRREQIRESTHKQSTESSGSDAEASIQDSHLLEDLQQFEVEPLTWEDDNTQDVEQGVAYKSLHAMESQTDWEVLGLGWGATEEEVNQSFRRLVVQLHPDKNPGDPDAAAKTRRVYEARQCALQCATPSNFRISHTPDDKPFDPFDTKVGDQYIKRIRKGEARRAEEKARKLEADAKMTRDQVKYREILRARVAAPKPIPIFDGRADPFCGNPATSEQATMKSHSRKTTEGQGLKSDTSDTALLDRPQIAHTIHSYGHDGTDDNPSEVIEKVDFARSSGTTTSAPASAPITYDDDDAVHEDINEIEEKENSKIPIKTSRIIPLSGPKSSEGDLLDFSEDEGNKAERRHVVPDPFEDLRSFFQKKTKQSSNDDKPYRSMTNNDVPIKSKTKESVKDTSLVSEITPASSDVSKSATLASSLDDIFQDLATLIFPDQSIMPNNSTIEPPEPNTDLANGTASDFDKSSGIDNAHAKLAEKIQTRLHKEEAERLERLRHKDPKLYHQIKGQRKEVTRDTPHESSPARSNNPPRSTTVAKPPHFDRPWNTYRDTKTRVMAFMAQQEKEKEDLDRIRNRSTRDIFQAHKEQAARIREKAERQRRL